MIKAVSKNIATIKKAIQSWQNENAEVDVKVNLGRNKFVTYKATVSNVYPALFTLCPSGAFRGKTSFSYAEVMCGTVVLKADREKNYVDNS